MNLNETTNRNNLTTYSEGGSSTFGKGNNKWFKEWRKMNKRDNEQAGSKAIWEGYGRSEGQISNLKDSGLVGITSPPYEEAVDGGGIFKKGYIGNFSHSKNPDTVGNRTYSNKTHNFSEGQIGSLKAEHNQELDFDITQYHKCGGELYWQGCYGSETYYKQFVTPESFAHPAKISFLLAERIFRHLEHLGLLKEGMTICDFMAGSGRIPLIASLKGYDSVGVELEPHFIKMCEDNKKFAENKIGRKLNFEIIQGDSRQLSKILNKGDVGVVSPPYANPRTTTQEYDDRYDLRRPDGVAWGRDGFRGRYGENPENIGNLKYEPIKEMVGVVSPPYQDVETSDQSSKKVVEERIRKGIKGAVITDDGKYMTGSGKYMSKYSQNPQNIGNLKDKELVGITSPPYENDGINLGGVGNTKGMRQQIHNSKPRKEAYGSSKNQLGNQQGQSYLSEMLQVYQEAYKSGIQVLVTITKNPTRAGKLRLLSHDTLKLLELSNFKIVDYHRAVLFKTFEQSTLTGETKKEHKGRLSFFKRLSLSKGNKAAEFEDIIISIRK